MQFEWHKYLNRIKDSTQLPERLLEERDRRKKIQIQTLVIKKTKTRTLNLIYIYIYIYIYHIIIMSFRYHGYPWPSLATSPYRSSPLAGLQGYISYPHIAAICMCELDVQLFLGHMQGSIGVHHLWAHPCFSSSVLHVWFV